MFFSFPPYGHSDPPQSRILPHCTCTVQSTFCCIPLRDILMLDHVGIGVCRSTVCGCKTGKWLCVFTALQIVDKCTHTTDGTRAAAQFLVSVSVCLSTLVWLVLCVCVFVVVCVCVWTTCGSVSGCNFSSREQSCGSLT